MLRWEAYDDTIPPKVLISIGALLCSAWLVGSAR